jgi:hypothetical protein
MKCLFIHLWRFVLDSINLLLVVLDKAGTRYMATIHAQKTAQQPTGTTPSPNVTIHQCSAAYRAALMAAKRLVSRLWRRKAWEKKRLASRLRRRIAREEPPRGSEIASAVLEERMVGGRVLGRVG